VTMSVRKKKFRPRARPCSPKLPHRISLI
jgi:hypothetical protein